MHVILVLSAPTFVWRWTLKRIQYLLKVDLCTDQWHLHLIRTNSSEHLPYLPHASTRTSCSPHCEVLDPSPGMHLEHNFHEGASRSMSSPKSLQHWISLDQPGGHSQDAAERLQFLSLQFFWSAPYQKHSKACSAEVSGHMCWGSCCCSRSRQQCSSRHRRKLSFFFLPTMQVCKVKACFEDAGVLSPKLAETR